MRNHRGGHGGGGPAGGERHLSCPACRVRQPVQQDRRGHGDNDEPDAGRVDEFQLSPVVPGALADGHGPADDQHRQHDGVNQRQGTLLSVCQVPRPGPVVFQVPFMTVLLPVSSRSCGPSAETRTAVRSSAASGQRAAQGVMSRNGHAQSKPRGGRHHRRAAAPRTSPAANSQADRRTPRAAASRCASALNPLGGQLGEAGEPAGIPPRARPGAGVHDPTPVSACPHGEPHSSAAQCGASQKMTRGSASWPLSQRSTVPRTRVGYTPTPIRPSSA